MYRCKSVEAQAGSRKSVSIWLMSACCLMLGFSPSAGQNSPKEQQPEASREASEQVEPTMQALLQGELPQGLILLYSSYDPDVIPTTPHLVVLTGGFAPSQEELLQEADAAKSGVGAGAIYFRLFPGDPGCACIRTKKDTRTVTSNELTIGKSKFQVFRSRQTGQEVFRIRIGVRGVTWWNYGIVREGDFNGDGMPDFSWYGGDDTSSALYVFLSSAAGYRKLDIYETVENAWRKQFPGRKPLTDIDAANSDRQLGDEFLVRDSRSLSLRAVVVNSSQPAGKTARYSLHVGESDFVFSNKLD